MLSRLSETLPKVRGTYAENAPLKDLVWFRAGGPAEILFRPADADDLAQFLAAKPPTLPVTVIGVGSNLLVREGGIKGVVIRLSANFGRVAIEGMRIRAGAAALDAAVARAAADAGLAGLEFLRGVPGTIGGALRMNAGAYEREICDVLVSAEAIDIAGQRRTFRAAELDLSYRHCGLGEDWIFTAATLQGAPGEAEKIAARMAEIGAQREASQPVRTRTGGSTFANPSDPRAGGRKAWQLIDEAGCRGLRLGGAQVSELHCNFLINTGSATAADLEGLGEEVRRRVADRFGVDLQWEIRRLGRKGTAPEVRQ